MWRSRLDVLVLASRPEKPSYRFRVDTLLPELDDQGIYCRTLFYCDMGWQRFRHYLDCSRFDVVLVQKRILQPIDRFLIRKAARHVVFDFDDALGFDWVGRSRPRAQKRLGAMVRFADHVCCGNTYLASLVGKYGRPVTVIPTSIDTERFVRSSQSRTDSASRVVVGWIGSRATLGYLDELLPVLAEIDGIVLKVVADSFEPLDLEQLGATPFEFVRWSAENEVSQTASFDIGVMPLPDNNFTRGKCGFKALQYMAMGVPAICSPVGMNRDLVHSGTNGFLAGSPDEWKRSLKLLVGDASMRRRIGDRSRLHVVEHFSASTIARQLADVLHQVTGLAGRGSAA